MHPLLSIKAHSQSFILKHFKSTHYAKYLNKIRNSHFGESCFVIGNGPSLTIEDLEVLSDSDIDSFAVNRIFKVFPQTKWRPTYYVNSDSVMIRDCISDVEAMEVKDKFIPLQNKYYLGGKVKGAHYFFRNDLREKDQPEGFSLDCTDQVNTRETVTIDCMQLAMHMGYKNIYLIGVDHNFDKIITEDGEVIIDTSVKNYFCEGYDDDIVDEVTHDIGKTTKAYMDLRKFIDNTDVKIYNATRASKLNVFEKITFEDAIKQIKTDNRRINQ